MTTTYPSIEEALRMGIHFSGRGGELKPGDLEGKGGTIQGALGVISPEMSNLFDAADINESDTRDGKYNAMIYDIEVKGKDGIPHKAQLGVTTFRNGYNLWLIDVESGMCIRT